MSFYKSLQKLSPKSIYINKYFKNNKFTLLDIGAGNNSASKTKALFPNCEYHGVDLDKSYNNNQDDFDAMTAFYEMDLTKLQFNAIPDNYFDFIRMAHVIEHLTNGDEVLKHLIPKIKLGGYFYVEYPGNKSKKLPSMSGTLNFHDDPTHVRLYSVTEIEKIFEEGNCNIIASGTRRNTLFLLATPFRIMGKWIKGKKLEGNIFWDLLGFAEFAIIQKPKNRIS
ncbi:class I SAM-dependent methyltransferase [Arachidicoccus sp.]|uniref:class I SAM-dependent methyltransferase n=1 Tax=Arachidicoccus sp. TaxID=1872624 RepID=UPI003D1949B0